MNLMTTVSVADGGRGDDFAAGGFDVEGVAGSRIPGDVARAAGKRGSERHGTETRD